MINKLGVQPSLIFSVTKIHLVEQPKLGLMRETWHGFLFVVSPVLWEGGRVVENEEVQRPELCVSYGERIEQWDLIVWK